MNSLQLNRSALVITPSPHMPREYGNRNRVFQTVGFLKSFGYSVSCLLYPFDEDWEHSIPPYYAALVAEFDYFAVIPNSKQLHQRAAGYHHQIDEWWDDNIGHHLTWLFQRKQFDLLFVNYTFLSKAFHFAPNNVIRVLDTHDLFTGRREVFEKFGVMPEFFYTNAEEEKNAFDRADTIIAIKQSECDLLRTMTSKRVISLPYWDQSAAKAPIHAVDDEPKFTHDRPLRVGFIGAQNSVNIVNLRSFLAKMARYVAFYNAPLVVVIAGNVCRHVEYHYPFVKIMGHVEHISDFYQEIDAVIAPLEFSTGIKIKVGEALAWQKPVLATQNAFDGFTATHPTQSEASVDAVCRSLVRLAFNEISYGRITSAARRASRAAKQAQDSGFEELRQDLRNSSRKVLLITDRPIWHRATYVDELAVQAAEYLSNLAPTIVLHTCTEAPQLTHGSHAISYVHIRSDAALKSWLDDANCVIRPIGSLHCVSSDKAPGYRRILDSLSIPNWDLCIGSKRSQRTQAVLLSTRDRKNTTVLSALRYAPLKSSNLGHSDGVTIWMPDRPNEWENLVLSLIEYESARAGLTVTKAVIPEYGEFDPVFFATSILNRCDRWIILRRGTIAEVFLLYTALYLDLRTLILEEHLACPESQTMAMPSVSKSLRAFINGEGRTRYSGDGNSGWNTLWRELESEMLAPARPLDGNQRMVCAN